MITIEIEKAIRQTAEKQGLPPTQTQEFVNTVQVAVQAYESSLDHAPRYRCKAEENAAQRTSE